MRQLAISTLALLLGAAAALTLVSCGGEDAKLLPGDTAAEITENLDRVKQYAEEGECVGAEDAASEINAQVEGLTGVDPKLVEVLQRGAARLSEVIATCDEEETEAVAPSNEATTTEETEKAPPPGLEKKEEKEREKEEKTLEKEEEKAEKSEPPATETTPEEQAPPATTPTEGGGTDAPGGVSPGTPVAPEEGGD